VHHYVTSIFDGILVETADYEKPSWYPLSALPIDEMCDADCYIFPRLIDVFVHTDRKFNAEVWYREPSKGIEHIEIFPFGTLT
jgi:hypothetical protein